MCDVRAQVAPLPGLVDQANKALGGEVETLAIAAGDSAFAGGFYKSDPDDANIDLSKVAVRFELLNPVPIRETRWKWSPVLQAAIGYVNQDSTYEQPPLAGNGSTADTFAAQLGGGARFYFTTNLSLALSVAGMYGNTENKFQANNAAGQTFKNTFGGTLVDWNVDTWTVVRDFTM